MKPKRPLPGGARLAVIIRDDDTCALTPSAYLQAVYGPAWELGLPVSLATVPSMLGSRNLNLPPGVRGDGREYRFAKDSPAYPLLDRQRRRGLVEIVQHGYRHTTDTALAYPEFGSMEGYSPALLRRSSEFYGASAAEAESWVAAGKAALEDAFGPGTVTSFVAPQEYLTPYLWRALRRAGLRGYSGGIRPALWRQLPMGDVSLPALGSLAAAVLRRVPPPYLGEYVARLTPGMPILPATYRHYWSGYRDAASTAATLASARAILKRKYEAGDGYFLLLTHYWEYFGDWREAPTQAAQLDGLHALFKDIASLGEVWPCTLGQYCAFLQGVPLEGVGTEQEQAA